ncbi:UDP-glucose 4-epimerase [archaeon HR06]|nr:UDP-glucose 4-epimerase [archaeon HR06]
MSFLITGGTGFIGSYVVKELDKLGEEVLILSRSGKSIFSFSKNLIIGDIKDFNKLLNICREREVKRIIHLAGYTTYLCQSNLRDCLEINCVGTYNLLELARRLDVERFIFSSTATIYGDVKIPKSGAYEGMPVNPVTFYAISKLMGENLGLYYLKNYGIDFGAFRISGAYGYSNISDVNREYTLSEKFRILVEGALKGKDVIIEKGGLVKVDWVYVEDCAWLLVKASLIKNKLPHNIYNLGSGYCKTLLQISKIIKKLIPNSKIKVLRKKEANYPSLGPLNIKRAKEDFGYKPRSIEEGLKDYISLAKKFL